MDAPVIEKPIIVVFPAGLIDADRKNLSDSLKKQYPQLKDSELLVTADADITSKHLNKILLILDQTKVKKISLLTLKNE